MQFKAEAHHECKYLGNKEYEQYPEKPGRFTARMYCATREEASEIAAKFPKFVKVHVVNVSGRLGVTAAVYFQVDFYVDGVNKGKNETGLKRLRRFLEIAGEPTEWNAQAVNSYRTFAEFMEFAAR